MTKLVWRTLLFLLSLSGLFVYVFYVAFAGDVMARLLTPEEQAAAASARFGPGQPGPMAPGPSECGVFLSYSSLGLLLLPMSDQPSDLSCFFLRRLLRHFYLRLGRVLSWGSWRRRRWSPAVGVFIVRFFFLTLWFCICLFFFEQIASKSV